MTLREYKEKLDQLIELRPEALDLPVIYSKDDEGNEFREVVYSPCDGKLADDTFEAKGPVSKIVSNAVCIN